MLLRRYFSEPTTSRHSFSPTPISTIFSWQSCCLTSAMEIAATNLTNFSKAHFFEMDNWSVEFYVPFLFFVFLKKQNKTKKWYSLRKDIEEGILLFCSTCNILFQRQSCWNASSGHPVAAVRSLLHLTKHKDGPRMDRQNQNPRSPVHKWRVIK